MSRRREHGQLLHPLMGTSSSPPTGVLQQHMERQQRAQQTGISPAATRTGSGRFPPLRGPASRPIMVTGQPAAARQKDKFVPLPEDDDAEAEGLAATAPQAAESLTSTDGAFLMQQQLSSGAGLTDEAMQALSVGPGIFEDIPPAALQPLSRRGRITLYCNSESFDRKKLHEVLHASFTQGAIKVYPDCFYVEYAAWTDDAPGADVFFFDYGVVCCWGLDAIQESSVIRNIARHAQSQPIEPDEMEIDQFEFNVSSTEKPHIQNDTVTLHRKAAKDHRVKLAISYALSQSTKLSLYEKRVVDMVLETKHLPEQLAATGLVPLEPEMIAKLIGKVFIQRAAVNLLSSVLDTPEFFWREADSYQALYGRICEYLELAERVEVLNARFAVLQEMLDMLRDHQNNKHSARLEMIVIWLILVEVVVGLLELMGLFGFFPH